jgi:nucleotide-binding universal stress UspA family protein
MTELIAVIEDDLERDRVHGLADSLAALLTAKVVPLTIAPRGGTERVMDALDSERVVGAVLAATARPESAFWQVIRRAGKPIGVVPFGAARLAAPILRILVPLDDTSGAAAAVAPTAARLLAGGADLVAAHVFSPATVPAFWDQAAHARDPWSREFLARNLPAGVRVDLRHGRPAEEVLAGADEADAGLILMGWAQCLDEDRAHIVRLALRGSVPVLLVGGAGGPSEPEPGTLDSPSPPVPRRTVGP